MANIKNYILISDDASSIKENFISPKDFHSVYSKIFGSEKEAFLRHFLINNIPFVFKSKPILFEQITQYLADNLNINSTDIKLIGSGKTGFSISPPPSYGNSFSEKSDLDFTLINESIFHELKNEFYSWADQFRNGYLLPKNLIQETYWNGNLENCSKTINRGFIDTHKIPSYSQFKLTQSINNSLYLIKYNLELEHNISIKKASIRVYKDWGAFSKQLKLNTEYVLNLIN